MSAELTDPFNSQFALAAEYIAQTNQSLFLTGKAGTGKTTFLKYIRQQSIKNMAVVAPTGVAAINAGGVTIHSFFQLPVTPFIPEQHVSKTSNDEITDKHSLISRLRYNRDKIKLLQQLQLLVIDEISMVRCDVLDAIDTVLRHFRSMPATPFGGVQVLFIGDMFQLAPVATESEWQLLSSFYESPYFFSSKAMLSQQYAYVELNKIYRQRDNDFIHVLNQVRNNELDEEGYALLHSRYQQEFRPGKDDHYIILTTHNYRADAVNNNALNALPGNAFISKALIKGEFYEKSYPAEESLQLKVNAQVMFIKNDTDKRFYNGKVGIVTKVDDDVVTITCKNDDEPIEVRKEVWRNIRYTFNAQTKKIEEEDIGSFTQFPLRLAWAITIHKSQGLTFEKAIIDAGASFAPGQVYVALSRCTNLQGMVLLSRITAKSIQTDKRITNFINSVNQTQQQHQLKDAKKEYQQNLLLQTFSFDNTTQKLIEIIALVNTHAASFNEPALPWLHELQQKLDGINVTATSFQKHLYSYFKSDDLPEENEKLQQRIQAAASYFIPLLQSATEELFKSPVITDSKPHALSYNDEMRALYELLTQKLQLIKSLQNGFHVSNWHKQKTSYTTQLSVNSYSGTSEAATSSDNEQIHPELYRLLKQVRDKICAEKDMPVYLVASSATLNEMAKYLPQSKDELLLVSGFGKAKVKSFGEQFLDVITAYASEKNLPSLIYEKEPKRKRKDADEQQLKEKKADKTDTKIATYNLYKQGKKTTEIAEERNLTTQTIEGHLAYFVQTGAITIDELVSREKFVLIEPVVKEATDTQLTPMKQKLGSDITYGEIRLVMAAMEYEKNKQNNN